MRRSTSLAAILLGCSFAWGPLVAFAQPQDTKGATPRPGLTALKQLLDSIKSKLHPLAAERVQQARENLQQKIARLEAMLDRSGENGQEWRKYLALDVLKQSIAPDAKPNPAVFGLIQVRFNAKHVGLEEPEFADTALALRQFREVTHTAASAATQQDVEKQLDPLIKLVGFNGEKYDPTDLRNASEALGLLDTADAAPELVSAVRQEFSRPNLLIQLNESMVSQAVHKDIDERQVTCEYENKTSLHNRTHTIGVLNGELVPDENRGVIHALMHGTAHTQSTARKGPAIVNARATTKLYGEVKLSFDADGVKRHNIATSADTSICFTGFGSTKGGPVGKLVTNIASRKAPEQRASSEQKANRKAKSKLSHQLTKQTGEMLDKANKNYKDKIRLPLVRHNAFPRLVKVASTSDELTVTIAHDDRFRLAAPNEPPALSAGGDASVRLHESFFNNMAGSVFAGRTITQEDVNDYFERTFGEIPEGLQNSDEDKKDEDEDTKGPWSITFADPDPFTLRIDDKTITLTMRGRRYTAGEKSYEAMNVTVKYKAHQDGKSVVWTREGDIETLPPDFKAGQTLSPKQTVLARLLKKRMNKLFDEKYEFESYEFDGELAKLGTLVTHQWQADNGWLMFSWKAEKTAGQVANAAPLEKPAGAE